jgi:putative transposase
MTFEGDYRPDRCDVLDGAMLSCCAAAMRKVCADFGAGLRESNGETGHVRSLVDHLPKAAVSALVNSLKDVSARRLRSKFTGRVNQVIMRGHFWSLPYLATSCRGAPPTIIYQYIEQQQRLA